MRPQGPQPIPFAGLGQLPFGQQPPRGYQAWPPGDCLSQEMARCADLSDGEAQAQLTIAEALQRASQVLYWFTQPTPLEAVPFRGEPQELFARVGIAPPTAPGDAAGLTGIQELLAAESVISGTVIPLFTPATTAAFVTVASLTVPPGRCMVAKLAGSWGHDFLAVRDVIRYRITAGGRVISGDRELGLIGGLDNPVLIQHVLFENEVLGIDVRNLDATAGSLLEVRIQGWTFPVNAAHRDSLQSLLDPDRGVTDASRFKLEPLSGSC